MENRLLNFFFPKKCPFCATVLKGSGPLCGKCAKSLPYTKNVKCCVRCGCPLPSEFSLDLCRSCKSTSRNGIEHVFVPLIYSGQARRALVKFKFYRHPSFAEAFALLIAEKIISYNGAFHIDFITYVPQNKRTHFLRGYNQSELLARWLSSILKLPCKPCLVRTDAGARQATLSSNERKRNVRKSYFPMELSLSGNALLVDDVLTTGSTAFYCADLLKKMGCSTVYAATALVRAEGVEYNR